MYSVKLTIYLHPLLYTRPMYFSLQIDLPYINIYFSIEINISIVLLKYGGDSRRTEVNSENDGLSQAEEDREPGAAVEEERSTLTLKETFFSILSFLMAQSYIASLIIMMVGRGHSYCSYDRVASDMCMERFSGFKLRCEGIFFSSISFSFIFFNSIFFNSISFNSISFNSIFFSSIRFISSFVIFFSSFPNSWRRPSKRREVCFLLGPVHMGKSYLG